MDPHPESVPINRLVPIPGTPLADSAPIDGLDFIRWIAVARIMFPRSVVRIAAGREQMSDELQALCLLAGANSIFVGARLLTTPNPGRTHDEALLDTLGVKEMGAH
jgi:biotin synthase